MANDAEFRTGLDITSDDDEDKDDADMTEEGIESGLKMLGNVKRRRVSPLIRKDLLGVDGQVAMIGMNKKYAKEIAREKIKQPTGEVAVNRRRLGSLSWLLSSILNERSHTHLRKNTW